MNGVPTQTTEYNRIYELVSRLSDDLDNGRVHLRRASDGAMLTDLGDAVRAILAEDLQGGDLLPGSRCFMCDAPATILAGDWELCDQHYNVVTEPAPELGDEPASQPWSRILIPAAEAMRAEYDTALRYGPGGDEEAQS